MEDEDTPIQTCSTCGWYNARKGRCRVPGTGKRGMPVKPDDFACGYYVAHEEKEDSND